MCVCVCGDRGERDSKHSHFSVSYSNDQIVLGSSKYTSLNMCVHASPETVRPDRTRGAAVAPQRQPTGQVRVRGLGDQNTGSGFVVTQCPVG